MERQLSAEDGLTAAVRRAYARPASPVDRPETVLPAHDPAADLRLLRVPGGVRVLKRRPIARARRERELAVAAAELLRGAVLPAVGVVRVVVPGLVPLGEHGVLVSDHLGTPLDRRAATALFPPEALAAAFDLLVARGVEFSGFVPRNIFRTRDGIAVIDWEDAVLSAGPAVPGAVTTMKWDIGWADALGHDPGARDRFPARAEADEPGWDRFEQTLADIVAPVVDSRLVRAVGVRLTLGSELVSSLVAEHALRPAELGHLAADVLPPHLELLHTAVTATVRARAGEAAFAGLVEALDAPARAADAAAWARTLVVAGEKALTGGGDAGSAARVLARLRDRPGWDNAVRRAAAACALLAAAAELVVTAFAVPGTDLLVRGSTAQGLLGLRSDVDFELSSPDLPGGAAGAERCLIGVLGAFGLAAEGSAGRPAEADLVSQDGRHSRDLHEWCELRRPSSPRHDPGWAGEVIVPATGFWRRRSHYEECGRENTAKYLWFEVRAMVARCAFGADPRPSVLLPDQLVSLRDLVPPGIADATADLARRAFALRESDRPDPAEVRAVARGIDGVRARLGLPGPAADERRHEERG